MLGLLSAVDLLSHVPVIKAYFRIGLSLGLSLGDPYLWELFHSALQPPVCYPCWDYNPFFGGCRGGGLLNVPRLTRWLRKALR